MRPPPFLKLGSELGHGERLVFIMKVWLQGFRWVPVAPYHEAPPRGYHWASRI